MADAVAGVGTDCVDASAFAEEVPETEALADVEALVDALSIVYSSLLLLLLE